MNTDAFGPYLELLGELYRGSLAGTNAQKMARRALGPATPVLPLLRRLGERAGRALSVRARARG